MSKPFVLSVQQLEDRVVPATVAVNVSDQPGSPQQLVAAGGKLYFSAQTGTQGRELWISDGTANGTKQVKDISQGVASSLHTLQLDRFKPTLVAAGGSVVFLATSQGGMINPPYRLWTSDGTANGTVEVGLADPDADYNVPEQYLTVVGNNVYFFATNTATTAKGLWKVAGGKVSLVEDFPGATSLVNTAVHPDGTFFAVVGTDESPELWHSDGTAGGTKKVTGLVKDGANDLFIAQMFAAGNSVYFFSNADAPGEAGGRELWKVAPDGPRTALGLTRRSWLRTSCRERAAASRRTWRRSTARCFSLPRPARVIRIANRGSRTGRQPAPLDWPT